MKRLLTLILPNLLIACVISFIYLDYRHEKRVEAKYERRNRQLADVPPQHFNLNFNIETKRAALRTLVWGSPNLPKDWSHLKEVSNTIIFDRLPAPRKLVVTMPQGLTSNVYVFEHPGSQCLAIFHDGHEETLTPRPILQVLAQKCTVAWLNMPLMGGNSQPVVKDPRLGTFKVVSHEHLPLIDLQGFTPLQVFMQPVVETLNFLLAEKSYTTVLMTGLSGGGWTTTLYAAMDTRITVSAPVAGTLPIFLKSVKPVEQIGDFEQDYPALLKTADYLEMYVMGSDAGRSQLQILNKYDDCCFPGEASAVYAGAVSAAAKASGGTYTQWIDRGPRTHEISAQAAAKIIDLIH